MTRPRPPAASRAARRLALGLALAGAAASSLGACRGGEVTGFEGEAVALDSIVVARDRLVVKQGPVGAGKWKGDRTYVLVPATNPGDRDLMVTLRGELIADGARVALRPESIRLPAGGGERTFALVAEGASVPAPAGATAEVRVTGASAVDYAPPVSVSSGAVHQDQGRAVVAAELTNSGKGEVKATIAAAFYDAAGMPMERPFTVVVMTGGGKRGLQMVGPPGSKSAQLYVVEVQY